jgi:hypothetical protein
VRSDEVRDVLVDPRNGAGAVSMACKVIDSSGAVFALWGQPSKGDIDRVHEEMKRVAERSGHPIVYVTRVPTDAPAPDEEVRKYLSANMGAMIKTCSSYHVIMEGTGFVAAMKRGALTSLLQPIWRKKVFHVHAQARDVARSLVGAERKAAEEVLAHAERRGLLSCEAPTAGQYRSAQSA